MKAAVDTRFGGPASPVFVATPCPPDVDAVLDHVVGSVRTTRCEYAEDGEG
ncbi:hypothetical protein F3Y22_tig00111208pilonHSYRG00102 [Hibiscus syriacus]|uniref:Uncharacterized protein n=1 Tax=Hibiscus syriacus TaxID=106335 RepID=A0A6A2YVL4_HIBSY|nr:hypothetical protein F3Y22_tig00111208pilonHSYRG00102 [Hibiscus syriacus]